MARNRMIKVEFWSDEKIGNLSFEARLLFIGMWTFADDEGKINGNPSYLKSNIFPYDGLDINLFLKELEDNLLICGYLVRKNSYYFIHNFLKHQKIDKPNKNNLNPNPKISDTKIRKFLFDVEDGICPYCGREMELEANHILGLDPFSADETIDFSTTLNGNNSRVFSIDHIKPRSVGGTDSPHNLKGCCITCNKSKGNKIMPVDELSTNNSIILEDEKKRKEKKRKEKGNKKEVEEETPPTAAEFISLCNNFYGEYSNVYLDEKNKGKLLALTLSEKLSEQLINELSANIERNKANRYDEKFPNAHFEDLKSYLDYRRKHPEKFNTSTEEKPYNAYRQV